MSLDTKSQNMLIINHNNIIISQINNHSIYVEVEYVRSISTPNDIHLCKISKLYRILLTEEVMRNKNVLKLES